VSDSGDTVFGTTPNDVFTAINTLIKDLSSTGSLTGAAFSTQMDTALTNLTSVISNITTVNAQVGARNQEITSIEPTVSSLSTQYANEISRVDAVDLNEAAVRLKLQQTTLQAAQQTFVSSSKLSLFNYI
jgi:flagellar hook-associated protein 3 FlgL